MFIRPATVADLPGILEIYNEAILNTTATYDLEVQGLEQRQAWFEAHQRDDYAVFVAVSEAQQVVGWSALNRYRDRMGYRFTAENSVYVAAEQRGRGIGTRLLPPLIEAAQRRGLHTILAGIDAENTASLRLHTRFGFEQAAHFREVGFKFGRWLDVIYLQRRL